MSNIISLEDFAHKAFSRWTNELVRNGRSFPNTIDGLKESTRAIVTATARLSDFKGTPVDAEKLVGEVPQYKEARTDNVAKNLFRLANANTPLIHVISNDERDSLGGLDRIRGGYSKPGYVSIGLTALGKYIMKYREYFETERSEANSDLLKYKAILTPFPLSLVIPLVNLSDGISNKAPNLNILEVIDAYIEHLQNDKKSTTEQLAKHITGFETTPGSKILFSNQAVYDLIERGVCRGVSLSPIKFYKNEMLIQELPFRKFGISIMKEFEKLHQEGLKGKPRGFQSFIITGISPEKSDESLVTINYKINKGFTIQDVQDEIYKKTSMKDILLYKNIGVDLDSDKPLTIRSVREVLDYHVDLGLNLKSRSIKEQIQLLLQEREDAEFLEKVSREICVNIIGAVIGEPLRKDIVKRYLNNIYKIVTDYIDGNIDDEYLKSNYPHIDSVIIKNVARMKKLSVKQYGDDSKDNLMKVINLEVPIELNQELIGKIFQKEYDVLYNLNKRSKAIKTLKEFDMRYQSLTDSLKDEELKKEIIIEMKELRRQYEGSKFSTNYYALKENERVQKLIAKQELKEEIKRMTREMPLNILIDKDYKAFISINPTDKVANLRRVIECTTEDELVVICKKGNSYKVHVSEIGFEGKQLGNKDDIIAVVVDDGRSRISPLYVFVTNHGRAILVDSSLTEFYNKHLDIPFRDGEKVIYFENIPYSFYSSNYCLLLRTSDNTYKKRKLDEFVIKGKIADFYNMFSDRSATDNVIDACITTSDVTTLPIWNNGIDIVYCKDGFKRNVSMPDKLDYNKKNGIFIQDKIPHVEGNIITNANEVFNRDDMRKLGNILFEINHSNLNRRINAEDVYKLEFVKLTTSFRRLILKLDFVPSEMQVTAYVHKLGKQ